MTTDKNKKPNNEIEHGKILAEFNTEHIWGWGKPAGKLRAAERAKKIVLSAHIHKKMTVLEIGCGTGNFTELFAKTGADIIAVDISQELIRIAQKRNLANVKFICKRFEECELEGPFDAIIGSSVLHHLDIEQAMTKIYELLKPGGFISFAEPNMLNPQIFIERKFRFFRKIFWYVSPDETAFIKKPLIHLLQKKGFINITVEPQDWLHPATPEKLMNPIFRISNALEKIPFIKEFAGSLYISAQKAN